MAKKNWKPNLTNLQLEKEGVKRELAWKKTGITAKIGKLVN